METFLMWSRGDSFDVVQQNNLNDSLHIVQAAEQICRLQSLLKLSVLSLSVETGGSSILPLKCPGDQY